MGDCIAVTSSGSLLGKGACSEGGAPYKVTAVVGRNENCSDARAPSVPSGDYRLCLEVHLLKTYCYVLPKSSSGGLEGWITVPSACRTSGTVHVIDIVPGASTGDGCTRAYEWNYWYEIYVPQMAICVMEY